MPKEPRKEPGRGNASRPEKPQSSNLAWYLIVGAIILFVVFVVVENETRNRREVKLSEFMDGIRNGTLHRDNTFEVTFTTTGITYQDKPQADVASNRNLTVERYFVPLVGIDDQTKKKVADLLDEHKIAYSGGKLESDWLSAVYFLAIPLLFLVFFIYLLRRMGGAGSAMSFGRSRGRM